ncbi:glycosyltransferase family 2 protein [Gaetbulibacter sp. S0825]|nr:glycosyltransferase family 2 protein [Gaetbulibacter sp. S0825]
MNNPLISVIVPNYNHAPYLKQRLDSIFNQTYANFEVILLDDSSTDSSREILSAYSKKPNVSHCIFNKVNSGSTFAQWNKGVSLAKGDYIWIAESDDFCESNFLEIVIQLLLQNKDVALAYCQSQRVNSDGVVTGNWITHTSMFQPNPLEEDFIMDGNMFIENYLIHKNVIPNASAVLFNKVYLEKIMPLVFKPFMKYNADWFYYVQLICNKKLAFVAESLNHFRYHETSVIARADGESGMIRIKTKEIKLIAFMFSFLKSCTPKNINAIEKQYRIVKKKLLDERATIYIQKKQYFKAITSVFSNLTLLTKISKKILVKMRSSL